MNISATTIGMIGIQKGMQGMQKAASEIASAGNMNEENQQLPAATSTLVNAIVSLNENKQLVQASAKLVSASDAMVGSLLDISA